MSEFTESVWKVSRQDGYGITRRVTDSGEVWFHGTVRTPYGYVKVYAEKDRTALSIIFDGYEVTRVYKRTYTMRGIVTLARRFIEEQQP